MPIVPLVMLIVEQKAVPLPRGRETTIVLRNGRLSAQRTSRHRRTGAALFWRQGGLMVDLARRPSETVVLVLIVIGIVVTPFVGSRLAVYSLTITALYASVVVSLNLLLGLAGQASFSQTTFMAIGGYGSALLTTRLGLDPWLALAAAAGLALVFAPRRFMQGGAPSCFTSCSQLSASWQEGRSERPAKINLDATSLIQVVSSLLFPSTTR